MLYLALSRFKRGMRWSTLSSTLQHDVHGQFGTYGPPSNRRSHWLLPIGRDGVIDEKSWRSACRQAHTHRALCSSDGDPAAADLVASIRWLRTGLFGRGGRHDPHQTLSARAQNLLSRLTGFRSCASPQAGLLAQYRSARIPAEISDLQRPAQSASAAPERMLCGLGLFRSRSFRATDQSRRGDGTARRFPADRPPPWLAGALADTGLSLKGHRPLHEPSMPRSLRG